MRAPFQLTAAAAFTSLGTLVPAAAAARSGIVNPRALDLSVKGAAGHAAPGIDRELSGPARLAALLGPAAADLARALRDKDLALGRTGIFLGLPQPLDGEAQADTAPIASALEIQPAEVRLFADGRAGTSAAIAAACEAIRSGRVEHAVVGGCESKIDPRRLDAALAGGRLKCEDYPVGFMPGEAAALAVLSAAAPDGASEAWVAEPVATQEAQSYAAGGPAVGTALAEALTRALADVPPADGSVTVDLNGEAYRATDWAFALVRARVSVPIERLRPSLPAMWFGDVGAAYPVLAMGLAARAFARGYARGPLAVVCTSADAGARAALVMSHPV
jgi:3-oxoacyl-[acyl-carrier-protein] synthase-1